MEIILDANFIISCVRKKIDFVSALEEKGFKIVVPREVLQEMKDLKKKNGESHLDREAIEIAFEMIERNKLKKMSLGSGKVDDKLIEIGKKGIYIATLDNGIKRNIPNKIVINNSTKGIEIVRD